MEPKQKQYPAVDGIGDGRKVQCCKEQYCIATWNVRSMNQGKLEVVKLEMARENINILDFQKSIYFCFIDYAKAFDCVDHKKLWKRIPRRNGVAIKVNKRV